ncbi:MAG: chemotaxis protein CheC [Candidatus Omnitrophota bacterium]
MELKLTNLQLDALKEIGTIGAGNAATGLSKMLNKKVSINVPCAKVIKLEDVPELLGGPELLVTAVYFHVTGNFMGSILLILPSKEALRLVDMLLGRENGQAQDLDEYASSALKELGNISAGSYLLALSEIVNMKLAHSVPGLAVDMLEAVLDGILISLALEVKDAVVLDTEFMVEENKVQGHFLFLPEPEGLENILKTLNV